MAEQTSSPLDPFAMWRDWLSPSERQWNTFLNEVMGSPQYTETQGRLMEMYLAMQKAMGEAMGRSLVALDIPTRTDLLGLGERLSVIEHRLTAIEAHLAHLGGGGGPGDETAPMPRAPPARDSPEHPRSMATAAEPTVEARVRGEIDRDPAQHQGAGHTTS